MNGTKSKMAIGMKPIKIGDKEYDTKMSIDDTAEYLKKLQEFAIKIRFYTQEKDIDKVIKVSDYVVDYKRKFVKDAIVLGGLDPVEADQVIAADIKDVVGDGKIEVWLGFATQSELDEAKKLKN